jgi:hypothetical protein
MGLFGMSRLSLLLRNNIILGGGLIKGRLRTITSLNGNTKVELVGMPQMKSSI